MAFKISKGLEKRYSIVYIKAVLTHSTFVLSDFIKEKTYKAY